VKIVCGKCFAEVELPKAGESPDIECPSCGAVFRMPSLAEGEELPHPDTFPGYRIVAIVGHGGMGTVYRAIQLSMDREVAIKVLLRKYAHVPRFVSRFEREASALAVLNHPNIVAVIDRGRVEDMYYFVMEYLHGRTLRYLIRNDLLSVERSLDIAIQICQALEAAHACGVVHRDIKPSNMLIQDDGVVKVADFGIVHMVEQDDAAERERRSRLGTANYMSPEQRGTGEVIDARADIFGLGVSLCEMLTGAVPKDEPPSALNRLVPKELDHIVERAMRENREERFQSAAEMREGLEIVRDSMSLETTPATEALAVPILPALTCRACGEAVAGAEETCPHCGATVREACYDPDCDGLNPVRAERCVSCGGHIELLKRQRRDELETLLQRGEAHAAARRRSDALRDLEVVRADPHKSFEDLRERARETIRRLRRRRLARLARVLVTAAAALLLVAAAAGVYWLVEKHVFSRLQRREAQDHEEPTSKKAVEAPGTQVVRVAPEPPRPKRADAFCDYLLALTERSWVKRSPALRVMAACDAGMCLAVGRTDGQAAKRLANRLAEIERGGAVSPPADVLHARLAATLDSLCDEVASNLCSQPRLAKWIKQAAERHGEARRSAKNPRQTLEAATAALDDLLATAEAAANPNLDLSARLLFLDASLAPAIGAPDLRRAADRLIRATRFLVRHLQRQRQRRAALELLDDARRRLARAQEEEEGMARLAYCVEALVEALGATPRSGTTK